MAVDKIAVEMYSKIRDQEDSLHTSAKKDGIDFNSYSSIKFTGDDFKNTDFQKAITASDLNDPKFINYLNKTFNRTDITKDNVTLVNGVVSINIGGIDTTTKPE